MGAAGDGILDLFEKTIDAIRDITMEMPGARSPLDVSHILLRGERKMYVGVILLVLAALALVASR